jgi:hypothetical protein
LLHQRVRCEHDFRGRIPRVGAQPTQSSLTWRCSTSSTVVLGAWSSGALGGGRHPLARAVEAVGGPHSDVSSAHLRATGVDGRGLERHWGPSSPLLPLGGAANHGAIGSAWTGLRLIAARSRQCCQTGLCDRLSSLPLPKRAPQRIRSLPGPHQRACGF